MDPDSYFLTRKKKAANLRIQATEHLLEVKITLDIDDPSKEWSIAKDFLNGSKIEKMNLPKQLKKRKII